MFQFSRRSSYNMNRWSARFGFEKTGREISVHKNKFYKIGTEGYNPLYQSVRDEWVLEPFDMEEIEND